MKTNRTRSNLPIFNTPVLYDQAWLLAILAGVAFVVAMILVMITCQFLTQKLVASRTMAGQDTESPLMRQQRILLYVLPLIFGVGGIFFPIGVLVYWTVSNLWTLAQQFLVSRRP